MQTQITCFYIKGESPLKEDGRLMVVGFEQGLGPDDSWTLISDKWDEEYQEGALTIEINIPVNPCRFLGHAEGQAPGCYGFGNATHDGKPWYMENVPSGFAPEVVCLHCHIHTGEREGRKHPKFRKINDRGISEILPELTTEETGRHRDHILHVDRGTGKVIPE